MRVGRRSARRSARAVRHAAETELPVLPPKLPSTETVVVQAPSGSSSQPTPPGASQPDGPAGQVVLVASFRYTTRSAAAGGSPSAGAGQNVRPSSVSSFHSQVENVTARPVARRGGPHAT